MICKGQDLFGPCTRDTIKGTNFCSEHGGKRPTGSFGGRPARVNDGSGYQVMSVGFSRRDIERIKEAAASDDVPISEYVRRAVLTHMSPAEGDGNG